MAFGWVKDIWGFGKKILEFSQLKKDVEELKATVTQLKGEVSQLRGENTQIRAEVSQLRGENTQIRAEVTQIRAEVSQLRQLIMLNLQDISRQSSYTQRTSIQDDPSTINPQFSAPNVESTTRRAQLQEIELRLSEDDRERLNRLRRLLHYWFDVEE